MSKVIDSVSWVVVQDRKVLFVRTRGKAKFYLPGGKREVGEDDLTCLRREVREELDVAVDTGAAEVLARLDELADGHSDGTRVQMTAYTAPHRGELRPGREIAELAWLSSAEGDRCPPAGRRVLRLLAERGDID
ncbi:NUDIX hydrolase [Saccharomonospora piscinae]|uniref:NUDIX hydrolase n=1 Tax=Saccharomonospora piscinae TaxID=687388 RepID=UPI001ABEE648|nr:NUDIX domain-containing protein [Saccharomonospora piscinae]